MSTPAGPTSPDIWQMIQWIRTPFTFMRTCRQRYGDIFTVALSPRLTPVIFVSDPEALRVILTGDDNDLFEAPGELNAVVEPLLGAQSVIGLSGGRHRRMRQVLMPPFHGERMRSYGKTIGEITDEAMNQCLAGKPFPVRKLMQKISMRIILRAVFGLEEGARSQELETLLTTMLDRMSHPFSVAFLFFPIFRRDLGSWSPWGGFVRARAQIDRLIYAEIAERRRMPERAGDDILSSLMLARDEAGEPLTDLELRDELMTLLVAGHETTATALTWTLYWIHRLPPVGQKLLAELQTFDGGLSELFRLPYLNAVCSETLRIHPVGMLTFPRRTKSRLVLMGKTLEPGTIVAGCIYLTHHREDLYPDPELFRPERFLERRYSPYEYLPFGGGVRRCIGMAFAQFEMKLVIGKMMAEFELALVDAHPVRLVRRGLTAGPSPFQMVIKGKRNGTSTIESLQAH